MKTHEGLFILRRFRDTQDGRSALREIYLHGRGSAASDLNSQVQLNEIMTMTLDSSYTKPYVKFINDYTTMAEIYNDAQQTTGARLSEEMLRVLLEKAVSPITGLRAVKARERHAIAEGRPAYSYSTYVMLLKDEAERLDKRRMETRSRRPARVNQTLVANQDTDSDDEAGFQNYLAYTIATKNQRDGGWIDSATFKKLSSEARSAWNKLSSDDKATILSSNKPTTSINHTQLSFGSPDDDDEEVDDGEEQLAAELSVNNTEVNTSTQDSQSDAKGLAHPADINRMLSSSAAKKPNGTQSSRRTSSTARKVNTVSWRVDNIKVMASELRDSTGTSDGEDDEDEQYPAIDNEEDEYSVGEVNWPSYEGDIGDYWDDDVDFQ